MRIDPELAIQRFVLPIWNFLWKDGFIQLKPRLCLFLCLILQRSHGLEAEQDRSVVSGLQGLPAG